MSIQSIFVSMSLCRTLMYNILIQKSKVFKNLKIVFYFNLFYRKLPQLCSKSNNFKDK